MTRLAWLACLLLLVHCSSGSGASGGGGASGAGNAGAAGSAGVPCEPQPGADAASDAAYAGDGPHFGGGDVDADLDAGEPFPFGHMACYDPANGTGFDCSLSGLICCDKKQICYDPASEPSFCDLPYCK